MKPFSNAMIVGSKIKLRDKRIDDAHDDYAWQTDIELARLDALPQLDIAFSEYLLAYINELRRPSSTRRQFAIDTLGDEHIGNCVYYGINRIKGEAELGIMIGNRACWDKGYGADAVTTLVNYIFRETKLRRIYLKTLESNNRAQKCFGKCGFASYGHMTRDGFRFMLMEIRRKQWEEQSQSAKSRQSLKIK